MAFCLHYMELGREYEQKLAEMSRDVDGNDFTLTPAQVRQTLNCSQTTLQKITKDSLVKHNGKSHRSRRYSRSSVLAYKSTID